MIKVVSRLATRWSPSAVDRSIRDIPLFEEFNRQFVVLLGALSVVAAVLFGIIAMSGGGRAAILATLVAASVSLAALAQRLRSRYDAATLFLLIMFTSAILAPFFPDLERGTNLGISLTFGLLAAILVDRKGAWMITIAFATAWMLSATLSGTLAESSVALIATVGTLIVAAYVLDRVKRTLLVAADQYRSLFDHVPVALSTSTYEGRLVQVNQAFVSLIGTSDTSEALMRGAFKLWVDPTDREAMFDQIRQEGQVTGREVELQRADGTPFPARIYASSMVSAMGEQVHHFMVEDITEEVTARTALEELVLAKDRFLAAVSHELRTPLTAVVGLAAELNEHLDVLSVVEVAEFAKVISEQSSELATLVEDILVASRLEIGQVSVRSETLELADVIDMALAQFAALQITVERSGRARASADPLRVRQIVRNLVTNAKRAGATTIRVELEEDERWARATVVDNGPGVPSEHAEAIFQPYVSLRKDSRTDALGLGLYVSRSLAEQMNGHLTYLRHGELSRFVLDLPKAG